MTEFSSAGAWRLEWEEEDGGDSRLGQGRMRQGGVIITLCTCTLVYLFQGIYAEN